ncbi:CoA ester lyase [Naumannella sp. ID2617S]|uniref:CoA ester lyase n=1 Tax=Enemella dayhoffiae TaxID=2016507 RepID=A0A255H2E1_9ACTN|nr:CoA ester lyase [Enemella dayhoffiae]NNG18421.1 CoA ester lyase [Naumannella sp. ID2617S]OYO21526.1 CoA ester lyase [Enemella dayhoffiae]
MAAAATQVRRTVLAVPGSSDRFLTKARGLQVDAVFLDLEDAVAPAAKAEARGRIVRALAEQWRAPLLTVRVNDWSTEWTYADVIEVVSGAGERIDALVLPKVRSRDDVVALDLILTQVERVHGLEVGRIGIEAQIEDARGLLNVEEIAGASPRMRSLVFGPGDFMASVGMASTNVGEQPAGYDADAFHHVLFSILVAARAHGLAAIDGPFVAIRDVDGFRRAARRSAALGFDGKWVLHPDQVAAGNEIFTPARADFERSLRMVQAYAHATAEAGGAVGAIVVDDEMVDEAGMKIAQRIVAKGRAAGLDAGAAEAGA